uniref:RAD51 paralog D n=1 Tax=Chelonoidis abingdonii TaxID=106734 RepID=A0A8C0G4Y0_CHEAB
MVILRAGLCPGLTAEMIQLLKANGIVTALYEFFSVPFGDGCLSTQALVAVRRVLLAQFSAFPVNGADLYEELKSSTAILSTGSRSLDRLLDSGLYTGEVTELTGAPGSGKTQVCLSIAVSTSHDLKQNVLYVDSTGGFTASRLLQLAQTRTGDEEEQVSALQRIQVARVFDVYKMLDVLQELRCSVSQQVTNHVTRDGSSGHLKPALGRSWSFVPSTRVLLESREGTWGKASTCRIASLTKSSRQPTGIEVELDIGSCGVLEESPAASGEGC